MKCLTYGTFAFFLSLLCSCQGGSTESLTCDDLLAVMAQCSPELAANATCTQETLDAFSGSDLESLTCEELTDPGAADFAFNGCDEGSHPCGWFCCEDYDLTWSHSPEDWDFIDVVDAYQDVIPSEVYVPQDAAYTDELPETYGYTYPQVVDDGLGHGPRELAVEITFGRVPLPFEEFISLFEPATWGINLDHYLGGEVLVVERDDQGRVSRQVERMVLSALPCDSEIPLANMDMTKVEIITYDENLVTVYWRVMYSDNGSTLSDVGTVSFSRYGEDTLVEFHSAHLLGTPLGTTVPNIVAMASLGSFFTDHVDHYRNLVMERAASR